MTRSEELDDEVARRGLLVQRMVFVLPGFGRWASTIREFETPYGHAGIRQLEVLYILRHDLLKKEEISATSLATHLQIQRSVVTRILMKLESSGFITRMTDPRDHRAQQITITERGKLMSDYVEQEYFDEMSAALGSLEGDDLACMERSMQILVRVSSNLGVTGHEKRFAAMASAEE